MGCAKPVNRDDNGFVASEYFRGHDGNPDDRDIGNCPFDGAAPADNSGTTWALETGGTGMTAADRLTFFAQYRIDIDWHFKLNPSLAPPHPTHDCPEASV